MGWTVPVLALLLAGQFVRDRWLRPRAPPGAGRDPRRIAVLYFDDRSPDGNLRYLADGLTEGLIYELGQVRALSVISRYGVAPYRNANVTPDSVARSLDVGTLVEGTVAKSGNRDRGILRRGGA